MRIAALLGVKDEVEIIERTISHLRAIGVDLIVALDMNSTDGTQDILERYRSDADFWVFRVDNSDPDLSEFIELVYEAARRIELAGIDWLICLDADEYWLPASGNLKDGAALANSDVLRVDRFHVPLLAPGIIAMPQRIEPAMYDQLLLVVEPIPNFRNYMRDNPETSWIRGVPAPKVMARPACIKDIHEGMHDIVAFDESTVRRRHASDVIIAHVPFSTQDRFRRKIANVRKCVEVFGGSMPGDSGWHWRRWVEVADREGIDREFMRNVFDPAMVAKLRAEGVVHSAAELFEQRIGLSATAV